MPKPRSTDILSDSDVARLNAHLKVTKPWHPSVEAARLKLHYHQSALRKEERELAQSQAPAEISAGHEMNNSDTYQERL